MTFRRLMKDYALMWSMLVGLLLSSWVYELDFLLPYGLFLMLSLSYTRISPNEMKIKKSHVVLFIIQYILGIAVYFIVSPFDEIIAQGLALITLTPTAVSAPVVTAMMNGSISYVTAFLILGDVGISVIAPFFISYLYPDSGLSYMQTVMLILSKVSTLLVLPLFLVWGMRYALPKLHNYFAERAGTTFYIWCFQLVIITGKTVHFFKTHEELDLRYGSIMAASVLVLCLLLFAIGRRCGKFWGENPVNEGQSFGQKNTVLAIWMGLALMNPIVSLIPSFYVIWQNVFNSFQIAHYRRKQDNATSKAVQ